MTETSKEIRGRLFPVQASGANRYESARDDGWNLAVIGPDGRADYEFASRREAVAWCRTNGINLKAE